MFNKLKNIIKNKKNNTEDEHEVDESLNNNNNQSKVVPTINKIEDVYTLEEGTW